MRELPVRRWHNEVACLRTKAVLLRTFLAIDGAEQRSEAKRNAIFGAKSVMLPNVSRPTQGHSLPSLRQKRSRQEGRDARRVCPALLPQRGGIPGKACPAR